MSASRLQLVCELEKTFSLDWIRTHNTKLGDANILLAELWQLHTEMELKQWVLNYASSALSRKEWPLYYL